MNDMTPVIVPKSDQISADDLIAGPRTIRITDVDIKPGTEQPVSIFYDGDKGRPWKPCKSMSRVLVAAWGPDAKAYIGRSVTLYRDPTVKWGGMEVGGIRISHLSDIERDMVLALTATRGKRSPYVVKPLSARAPQQEDKAAAWAGKLMAKINEAADAAALDQLLASVTEPLTKLANTRNDLWERVDAAVLRRRDALKPVGAEFIEDFDDDPREGRSDEQHGDQFDGSEGEFA